MESSTPFTVQKTVIQLPSASDSSLNIFWIFITVVIFAVALPLFIELDLFKI